MKQEEKLDILKQILLTDERELVAVINERLQTIEDLVNQKRKLSSKVDPLIDEKLTEFVNDMPKVLGPVITKTLKQEIKNSKNEVIDALYPIMGQMIKKYVQNEIRLLSERIDTKVQKYSAKSLLRKVKSFFTGIKESEMILQEGIKSKVEQAFIIENGSGILLSSFSLHESIDKDMIAGMLTAIKSFVEDAFIREKQQLQNLEYDLYHIHIQNFSSFYIALIIEGEYSLTYKNDLENILFKLVGNETKKQTELDFNKLSIQIISAMNS